jgi:hypothetical protein
MNSFNQKISTMQLSNRTLPQAIECLVFTLLGEVVKELDRNSNGILGDRSFPLHTPTLHTLQKQDLQVSKKKAHVSFSKIEKNGLTIDGKAYKEYSEVRTSLPQYAPSLHIILSCVQRNHNIVRLLVHRRG